MLEEELEESLERLERDVHLKFYYRDDPWDTAERPKLYVKSTWRPEPWMIPQEIN